MTPSPDVMLFHSINGQSSRWLDLLAVAADHLNLFKGGISVALFWAFWFSRRCRESNRRIIIAAFLGVVLAIVLSRALTVVLPFRVRPLYVPEIGYHAPAFALPFNAEHWSSFPSDHAAMWFAMCYAIWRLSRVVGIIALLFSTLWIALVRVYLGLHYPSDVAVGAVIGWSCGWLAGHLPLAPLNRAVLAFEERRPHLFYPAMFLLTYETANIFDDLRMIMHGMHLFSG